VKRLAALALLCPAVLLVSACEDNDWKSADPSSDSGSNKKTATSTAVEADAGASKSKPATIRPARCPAAATNCAAAVGRVLFIESVDADGDGDLHVVASAVKGEAVTGAGLVVFDVNKDLRPAKDPHAGDLVTGAGPVFQGSYGQSQIEVTEFRVKRNR
jgi:hypothetical protein